MAGRDAQSVPWFAEDRPQHLLADGARLDGRSFEEFRSVCESSGQRRPSAPLPSTAAAAAVSSQPVTTVRRPLALLACLSPHLLQS